MLIRRFFCQNNVRKTIQSLSIDFQNQNNNKSYNELRPFNLIKGSISMNSSHNYYFSKQRILEQFQKINHQLQVQSSMNLLNENKKESKNEFHQKQEKIVKDYLQLTEQSFNQHLQRQLDQPYHIDAHILLMIISTLEDPQVIRENLIKLYSFINILDKSQLLLFLQLIVAHKPKHIPPFSSLNTRSLEDIQSVLLILAQIYPGQEKLIEWIKQIALYKGKNIYIIAAGFFSIYEKIDQHVKFKNQKLIQKCIDRIIHLAIDQDQQTKISIAILAFQSSSTSHFGEQLLIQMQKVDFEQIDQLKLQLLFIYMQPYFSKSYSQVRKQIKTKTQYKVLQQDGQGQVTQVIQEQYELASMNAIKQSSYIQLSQIQKYYYINSILKQIMKRILDLDWKKVLKLNLLIEYWRLFDTFQNTFLYNSLKSKLVNFTMQKQTLNKLTNLTINQIIQMLQIMEKIKINKSQLLIKLLALLSEQIQTLNSAQLIKLSKVCVTFVRQCQDFLITLRRQIQNRKFIFTNQQIDQLNSIFKRVLILFPRPLTK